MKMAIVTAILGDFDERKLHVPQACGTPIVEVGDKALPPRKHLSRTLAAKHPKMCGTDYVPADTEVVVWIDGSYRIATPDFARWMLSCLGDADFCVMRHSRRSRIADEAAFIYEMMAAGVECLLRKCISEPMARQVAHYLSDPTFKDEWLPEAGCFVYRNTPQMRAMLRDWLSECVRWTVRDQLSLSYVCHRHKVVPRFLPVQVTAPGPHLEFAPHRNE